jgi:t-SNARE complex subunit (syntaxin)
MTLEADLSLSTLEGQPFQASAVRYQFNQSAAYQSIQLYPHPAGNQQLDVRMVVNPPRMQEDQDAPIIPASYAQVIAYAALETLSLKVANPALSQVYARKKQILFQGMEARFLQMVPRRIIKGSPTAGYKYVRNPFGKLVFTP